MRPSLFYSAMVFLIGVGLLYNSNANQKWYKERENKISKEGLLYLIAYQEAAGNILNLAKENPPKLSVDESEALVAYAKAETERKVQACEAVQGALLSSADKWLNYGHYYWTVGVVMICVGGGCLVSPLFQRSSKND